MEVVLGEMVLSLTVVLLKMSAPELKADRKRITIINDVSLPCYYTRKQPES